MKPLRLQTGHRPWYIIRLLAAIAAVGWLLTYKLGSLTGGLAPGEQKLQPAHTLLHGILQDPLLLPLQLLRLAAAYIPHADAIAPRLPSVVAGALLLVLFTLLVRFWYGTRTAYFGLVLLATAPWFLHISRLGLNDVLYPLSLTALLLFYTLWQRTESRLWFWLAPLLYGVLLYIPGFIWFVLVGLIWQHDTQKTAWRKTPLIWRPVWLLLLPITVSLLAYACWHSPHLLYSWAGIPQHFQQPLRIVRNIGITWQHIVVRGPQSPLLGLGFLPLVDIFTTSMAIIGSYFYISHWQAPRSRMLLACAVLGTLLASINGPVASSILLPLIFTLAAGGIGYLLHEWLGVFPRNPLAKALGYGLLSLTLALAVFYNLHQYFVAWPHNTTTRLVFSRRV